MLILCSWHEHRKYTLKFLNAKIYSSLISLIRIRCEEARIRTGNCGISFVRFNCGSDFPSRAFLHPG